MGFPFWVHEFTAPKYSRCSSGSIRA
jgi:hypothetical protein